MVAALLSLLDPFTALFIWLAVRRKTFDVRLISGGETLEEACTQLATRWRGYLALRLKRKNCSSEPYVLISAMSANRYFYHVLTPAEFSWFAHNVERMRKELRSQQAAACFRRRP